MNKIGFIAIGQAGGNIGKLFEKNGFSVIYINTSQEDLDTLGDVKFTYHIPNGEGCNKDRNKAKQLIIDDYDNIAQQIDSKLGEVTMLFVIFASGGGTGSGSGPMLIDLLVDDGRNVGAITVIPEECESVKSHINSYESIKELMNITGSSASFILDNNKGDKFELNVEFAKAFCEFVQIPEKHKSVKGIIDNAEVKETLSAHGMAYVLNSKPGIAQLIDCLKDNPYAPIEYDSVIKYIAISIAGDSAVDDLQKAIGTPLDVFATYNDTSTICCITGLSYPHTRMESVYKKVQESKDAILNSIRSTADSTLNENINFLDKVSAHKVHEEHKPKTKKSIMEKYLKG